MKTTKPTTKELINRIAQDAMDALKNGYFQPLIINEVLTTEDKIDILSVPLKGDERGISTRFLQATGDAMYSFPLIKQPQRTFVVLPTLHATIKINKTKQPSQAELDQARKQAKPALYIGMVDYTDKSKSIIATVPYNNKTFKINTKAITTMDNSTVKNSNKSPEHIIYNSYLLAKSAKNFIK